MYGQQTSAYQENQCQSDMQNIIKPQPVSQEHVQSAIQGLMGIQPQPEKAQCELEMPPF